MTGRGPPGRRAVQAKRPQRHGGDACAMVLVRREDRIELYVEAVDAKAVELDERTAGELAEALNQLVG